MPEEQDNIQEETNTSMEDTAADGTADAPDDEDDDESDDEESEEDAPLSGELDINHPKRKGM